MERIIIPKRTSRGAPSKAAAAKYNAEMEAFAGVIIQIKSSLDFPVSARGWCYILEDIADLPKNQFDDAEKAINKCRKSGLLPLDICAEDGDRIMENIDYISDDGVDERAASVVDYAIHNAALGYSPFDVWHNQRNYVEMLVEKIDLKGIFRPVCEYYHIPFANAKGWTSLNQRAGIMERFAKREAEGKKCILLYCTDHDPAGLNIAESIKENMNALSGAVGWRPDNLHVDRFGLTYDFIEANGIKWIENLQTSAKDKTDDNGKKVKARPLDDPRHKDHNKPYVQSYLRKYGVRKVEANALVTRVDDGRKLCENAILKYVDADAMEKWNVDTNKIRDILRYTIINKMKEKI